QRGQAMIASTSQNQNRASGSRHLSKYRPTKKPAAAPNSIGITIGTINALNQPETRITPSVARKTPTPIPNAAPTTDRCMDHLGMLVTGVRTNRSTSGDTPLRRDEQSPRNPAG